MGGLGIPQKRIDKKEATSLEQALEGEGGTEIRGRRFPKQNL